MKIDIGTLLKPQFFGAVLKIGQCPDFSSDKLAPVADFVNKLEVAYNEAVARRKPVVDKFAKKDKSGRPIVEKNNIQIADIDGFNAEMDLLVKEEIEIDCKEIGPETLAPAKLTPIEYWHLKDVLFTDF